MRGSATLRQERVGCGVKMDDLDFVTAAENFMDEYSGVFEKLAVEEERDQSEVRMGCGPETQGPPE